jgi:hypothetical protein
MTIFQFLTVLAFVCVCIFITYQNQRKYIALLKQRDQLVDELTNVILQIGYYFPEGIHPDGDELKSAKKLLERIAK